MSGMDVLNAMINRFKHACLFAALAAGCCWIYASAQNAPGAIIHWRPIPTTTVPAIQASDFFAPGAFTGSLGEWILCAGGRSGDSAWRDDIRAIRRLAGGAFAPASLIPARLPSPRGRGASLAMTSGLLCLGGYDGRQYLNDAVWIEWNAEVQAWSVENKAPLPEAPAVLGAANDGGTVYAVGEAPPGDEAAAGSRFWILDRIDGEWREGPGCPEGGFRSIRLAVRGDGNENCLYLFGLVASEDGSQTTTKVWRYVPSENAWHPKASFDWPEDPLNSNANTHPVIQALPIGYAHVLVLAGWDDPEADKKGNVLIP